VITKIYNTEIRYAVGENGITEIDDFSGALNYPNFVIYYGDGTRRIVYNPVMTVEITPKEE
jgi:hypothetical protein